MMDAIIATAKLVGNGLIDLSNSLDEKMQKWSDAAMRPNGLADTECVGFINKEDTKDGVNLVIDIQAPANQDTAELRIWGVEGAQDGSGNERFNNIQLDFAMDYPTARMLTQKGAAISRDDIRAALAEPTTQLSRVIVGSQSGIDAATQEPLGERYDIDIQSLDPQSDQANKLIQILPTVLVALK